MYSTVRITDTNCLLNWVNYINKFSLALLELKIQIVSAPVQVEDTNCLLYF